MEAVLLLLPTVLTGASCLWLSNRAPLACSQEGLNCSVLTNNCSAQYWIKPKYETPTHPVWKSEPTVDVSVDEKDLLSPVLVLKWRAQMDGSIHSLSGTEVQVQEEAGGRSLCVQYVFHNKLKSMRNPQQDPWSFSLDRIVVSPGHRYWVSISNLPKPDYGTNMISRFITIPDCQDSAVKRSRVCEESGSLWNPNLSYNVSFQSGLLSMSFSTTEFCDEYVMSVQCPSSNHSQSLKKNNQTLLSTIFTVKSCCEHLMILPLCPRCGTNCIPHLEKIGNCTGGRSLGPPHSHNHLLPALTLVLFFPCVLMACAFYKNQRKAAHLKESHLQGVCQINSGIIDAHQNDILQLESKKKVLIIYSLDHPLYKDIVLKLSAFLIAECGTEVVLDLLDSTSLGTMGRMQWLERQKQMCDKILILCSQGVQAKWKAMCGGGRVTLREDVCSPTGDMLTPALTLIIPDLLQPLAFGKYMVAYFDEVFAKEDVPPPFNITLKYKLMKHFEELFFRILDQEKHEPGKVKRIEGIAEDEYMDSASGRSLRDAIEAFQAHQLEHPEWFEKECVDDDEEVWDSAQQCPLLADSGESSILYFVPEYKEGRPTLVNEVQVLEDTNGITSQSLLVNDGEGVFSQEVYPDVHLNHSSVQSLHPKVNLQQNQVQFFHPSVENSQVIGVPCMSPSVSAHESYIMTVPSICELSGIGERESPLLGSENGQCQHEVEPLSSSPLSADVLQRLLALQQSLGPCEPDAACVWKRPSSGSDQGYMSKASPQQDSCFKEDPKESLRVLSSLQEACLLDSINHTAISPPTVSTLL